MSRSSTFPALFHTLRRHVSFDTELIHQPEDEHFIGLIRDLAESYVSQEECLILLTISMKGNEQLRVR